MTRRKAETEPTDVDVDVDVPASEDVADVASEPAAAPAGPPAPAAEPVGASPPSAPEPAPAAPPADLGVQIATALKVVHDEDSHRKEHERLAADPFDDAEYHPPTFWERLKWGH